MGGGWEGNGREGGRAWVMILSEGEEDARGKIMNSNPLLKKQLLAVKSFLWGYSFDISVQLVRGG